MNREDKARLAGRSLHNKLAYALIIGMAIWLGGSVAFGLIAPLFDQISIALH